MRHIGDSGCRGPVGIPGGRRRAGVSSCILLYPDSAESAVIPAASRGQERLSAVSVAVVRCCARLHRDVSPVCHPWGAVALPPRTSPCCPIPPPPAPTGWQSKGCGCRPCPCLHPVVPATTPGFILPWLFFLLGQGSAWGTPLGVGWGCSPGPGEQGRSKRELGDPGEQSLGMDSSHGSHTPT